jgi:hypothetical protein
MPTIMPGPYPTTWPELSVVPTPPHAGALDALWPAWLSPGLCGALDTLLGVGSWDALKNTPDTPEHWYFPIKFPVPHAKGQYNALVLLRI